MSMSVELILPSFLISYSQKLQSSFVSCEIEITDLFHLQKGKHHDVASNKKENKEKL